MTQFIKCPLLILLVSIFLIRPAPAQETQYGSITPKQTIPNPEISANGSQLETRRSAGTYPQRPKMHSSLFSQAPEREDSYDRWARRLAIGQGTYYLATGLWPILHMRSFEAVTGPKTDDWLVKTVGALITVVGGSLMISGVRDSPSRDIAAVAVGSAAALTAVDVIYVAQDRIPSIYLLDAAGETVLIAGWTITLSR